MALHSLGTRETVGSSPTRGSSFHGGCSSMARARGCGPRDESSILFSHTRVLDGGPSRRMSPIRRAPWSGGGDARYTHREQVRVLSAREWACSSPGRAPALQAGGRGFESPWVHRVLHAGMAERLGTRLPPWLREFDSRCPLHWRGPSGKDTDCNPVKVEFDSHPRLQVCFHRPMDRAPGFYPEDRGSSPCGSAMTAQLDWTGAWLRTRRMGVRVPPQSPVLVPVA